MRHELQLQRLVRANMIHHAREAQAQNATKKEENRQKQYLDSLDTILKAAQEEYRQITFDRPNRQFAILRTYLWLGTVVFTGELTLFSAIVSPENSIFTLSINFYDQFYGYCILALVSSLIAFVMGVDALRGRGFLKTPCGIQYSAMAIAAMYEARYEQSGAFKTQWIEHLDDVILIHQKEAMRVGVRLRSISYLILFSVFFSLYGLFC